MDKRLKGSSCYRSEASEQDPAPMIVSVYAGGMYYLFVKDQQVCSRGERGGYPSGYVRFTRLRAFLT